MHEQKKQALPNNYTTPYILEEKKLNVASVDIFSRLLSDRIIFLTGEIDDEMGATIVAQLLLLDNINHDPIKIYINSEGGEIPSGLMIYDTIKLLKSEVHTLCMGYACSMASVILAVGKQRFILPNAKVMIHQPSGYTFGKSTDAQIYATELEKYYVRLSEIIANHTGKTYEQVRIDMTNDYWMNAEEAVNYGIVDKVM